VGLVGAFALPVLRPGGFPGLETAGDSAVSGVARAAVLNPHAWFEREEEPEADSVRLRELKGLLLVSQTEEHRVRQELAQVLELSNLFSRQPLARMPKAVQARVLRATDASKTRRSLAIEAGTDDGIDEGFAVVQGRTFLGTVASVRSRFARVQLVTDPHMRLEVAVVTASGQRAVGYLRGTGDPLRLPLRFVRAREGMTLRPGDPVVTSPADERVPADLLVGYVAEAGQAGPDGVLDVVVRSQMDLASATTVFALVPVR
jgi:cell shape-determining protein MreC